MVEKIDEVGKNSLRESWLYLTQDIERISVRIFESIFQKCPEAKKVSSSFLFPMRTYR